MTRTAKNTTELSPLKRAYLALEKAQARIESLQNARREPIAILGMGCRYPGGANGPDEYWDLLASGRDAIVEVPASRWDVDALFDADPDAPGKVSSRWGGFIDNVDRFDAGFFGISPREAESLDPQQRLLLEVTQEAFENAAVATDRLVNSQTGVFMGVATCDYYCLVTNYARSKIDAYLGTGTSPNAAAGRLSYVFGLRGPCVAMDTACSSSLVAIHLACQSLRGGECDMAIAGGVNAILSPELSITFSKARMLCEDGRCKTFDAAANGYVRGEGVGVIVLKRLSDAVADGDRILAVIRGSAVNQDGPSSGLTVPNGPSQQDVIRRALAVGDVQPEEIGYLETHGTGTALGDPIEMGAIGAVFGKRKEPLLVGSVKTNVGHLEGAAGIAGVMKVVLGLQHEQIPPHLHFKTPSPRIPWNQLPVQIPTRPTPWPRGERRRLAGASSFGFSGINAHVVLEEAPPPKQETPNQQARPERPVHVIPLSAKHPEALKQLARRMASHLGGDSSPKLSDTGFTAGAGRSHFEHRMAVVAETAAEAGRQFEAFVRGPIADEQHAPGLHRGVVPSTKTEIEPPKVVFLFSGRGSQYAGMGRQLYETEPVFRAAFQQCEEILREHVEHPLGEVVFAEDSDASLLLDTAYTQPALFALEYALVQLWRSWGIRPAASLGHGVGEYAAACTAGVFSLEDGLKLVAARGRLTSEPTEGELDEFCRVAQSVTYTAPRHKLMSNLSGSAAGKEVARPDYWCEHLRRPVMFSQGMAGLFAGGMRTFLEIGPQSTLLSLARECWEGTSTDGTPLWLSSLHPDRSNWRAMLDSLAELYTAGAAIDWEQFGRDFDGEKIALPTYPFQRRRYWVEPSDADLSLPAATPVGSYVHPLLGRRVYSAAHSSEEAAGEVIEFEGLLSPRRPAYLAEHQIAGTPILPAAAYMEAALAAAGQMAPGRKTVLEDVVLEQAMPFPQGQSRVVQLAIRPGSSARRFELYSRPSAHDSQQAPPQWTLHATGRLATIPEGDSSEDDAPEDAAAGPVDLDELKRRCHEEVPLEGFYEQMKQYGLEYGPSFRGLRRLWRGEREALGELELPSGRAVSEAGDYLLYPPLLDACLHVTVDLVAGSNVDRSVENDTGGSLLGNTATFVPVGVDRLRLFAPAPRKLFSHARLREDSDPAESGRYTVDLDLIDPQGALVARLEGLRAQQVDLSMLAPEASVGRIGNPSYDRTQRPETSGPPPQDISAELRGLSTSGLRQRITDFLEEEVVRILKLAGQERPSHDKSVFDLGMDSLMAVEFLYRINGGLKVNLPMQKLLENTAIASLAGQLVRELNPEEGTTQGSDPADATVKDAEVAADESAPQNVWFPDHRFEPITPMRLFCFHPPGGSAADYRGWPDALPADIEVCAVQLPGSGTREDEPPIEPWESLVEAVAEQMLDYLDGPFAFFGHGDGGLIALDVARFVQDRFGLAPVHLFVAGDPPAEAVTARPCSWRERALECPITAFAAAELEAPESLLKTVAEDLRQAIEG